MDESFYYPTSCLAQPIEQLINFLDDDEPLLLVYGETGTGKSALLSSLQLLDVTPAYLLVLKGRESLSPEKFIQSISRAWHCDQPEEKLSQKSQFTYLLDQIATFPEPALLVIDGGDKLPIATLAALVHMCLAQTKGEYCCRILLFGRPTLLRNFSNLHHPDIHFDTLELKTLSLRQTELFLKETLKQINVTLDYLTPEIVNTIFEQSNGIPKNIAQLAEEVFQSYQHPLLNNAMMQKKNKGAPAMDQDNNDHSNTESTDSLQPEHPLNQAYAVTPSVPSCGGIKNHWVKIICIVLLAALFFILSRYEHRIHDRNMSLATPTTKPIAFPTDISDPKAISPKPSTIPQHTHPTVQTNPAKQTSPLSTKTDKPAQPAALTTAKALNTQTPPATAITSHGPYHWQLMASMNKQVIQSKLQLKFYSDRQAYLLKKLIHGKQWYTLNIGHYPNKEAAKHAWAAMPANIQSHKPWLRKSE